MVLSDTDRVLLDRCLTLQPQAWERFVDRFMGLVVHVVNHTAAARSIRLRLEDRDDLIAEVFLGLIRNDFAVLRHFRAESSLATYLTVVARRIVVHQLLGRKVLARLSDAAAQKALAAAQDHHPEPAERLADRDEVQRLLDNLQGAEAEIVRLYHLEGKSYQEISTAVGMPENSIGPILSRARHKLRASAGQTS